MKNFHFGDLRKRDKSFVGRYALHIQCPWRIERAGRIVTGSVDFYERARDRITPGNLVRLQVTFRTKS
jgi:hypothetical protein